MFFLIAAEQLDHFLPWGRKRKLQELPGVGKLTKRFPLV